MSSIKNIVILGATGSIGQQTLDVVRQHQDELNVIGLVANSSKEKINADAKEFNVKQTLLMSQEKTQDEANKKLVQMITAPDVDIVVNAIGGAAGLIASYFSLTANKRLALANKESLVVGGDILMPIANNLKTATGEYKLLPIDSEHGAIFQCLIGETHSEIYKLHITASGGPFFGKKTADLQNVTCSQALAHPTWNMGPKITIDSATLMNKGLEVIEAHHLFNIDAKNINVVVQRQSAIHSMVEFSDGSVKAHLGTTDMRIPIQYALSYPNRWATPVKRMDFQTLGSLDFDKPDTKTFKCLDLAFKALEAGGTMPCVMNAANEVAVSLFLQNKIKFLDIAEIVENAMKNHAPQKVENIEQLQEIDKTTRDFVIKKERN